MSEGVRFSGSKVERRFTDEWAQQGIVRIEALPRLVETLVAQREEMLDTNRELLRTIRKAA
jgi:hypothetical protein